MYSGLCALERDREGEHGACSDTHITPTYHFIAVYRH